MGTIELAEQLLAHRAGVAVERIAAWKHRFDCHDATMQRKSLTAG
jgi:hypothetical protein